ncbi:MAG: prenyltransferase/squalene oxidase repeat-containing protein [Planctomycetia bacterium]|nr:prenyltransferase/squalene oxidase repeat-containing protein [Planctomycetia bacterium]
MSIDNSALAEFLSSAREQLLERRVPAGHWRGRLSPSALATATAVFALASVDPVAHESLVRRGLDWLARHRNADGGWGDTVMSPSNTSTTALCWSAFSVSDDSDAACREAARGAEEWLARNANAPGPQALAEAIAVSYGGDRTFSAPILAMCALAGRLGPPQDAWRWVYPLPFELAALPHRLLKWLRLPVVSYALPALIAVGQVRHLNRPSANPLVRCLRGLVKGRTLRLLASIQPASGGFLEAAPLTSFVVMSLAAMGRRDSSALSKGVEFLAASVLADGSWPIDTDLATWVTTLAVNALAVGPGFRDLLSAEERREIRQWLLRQQYLGVHPYTRADPGGWAWTDLPGGVPDADDTAGALRALRNLGGRDSRSLHAATAGINWLLGLQNRDGGIPTFCRGWGTLEFDRSAADLTAHALLAIGCWLDDLPGPMKKRAASATARGLSYLAETQRSDGSWVPLWFGNQSAPGAENPTYGTARVVTSLAELASLGFEVPPEMLGMAASWLLSAQNPDGGWGGAHSVPSSIEETAVAVDALAALPAGFADTAPAISKGVCRLMELTDRGKVWEPAPIGLYFAKLWYFERMYPLVFTVSALERVSRGAVAET